MHENLTEGLFRTSPGEGFVYVNAAFARMFGYASAEELQRDWREQGPEEGAGLSQLANESMSVRNRKVQLRRRDGEALWQNQDLIAPETSTEADQDAAAAFAGRLAEAFEIDPELATPAYEDPATYILAEHKLPDNLDPETNQLDDPLERRQLAEVFQRGLGAPTCMAKGLP